mgnify:CR=1 FL=1
MINEKHLYLPSLSAKAIQDPLENGLWFSGNKEFLMSKIAEHIEVSDALKQSTINSIPDVWARPLLFKSALTNKKHPIHEKIKQEWRGLLSLLALHEVYQEEVEIEHLDLKTYETNSVKFKKFVNALLKLDLEPVEWDHPYEWNQVFLIKLDGVAIGAFSPQTVVYTGTNYQKFLQGKKNFILKDELGNLTPPKTDNQEDEEYLMGWLQETYNGISSHAVKQEKDTCASIIIGLLKEWMEELSSRKRVPSKEGSIKKNNSLFDKNPSVPPEKYKVYRTVSFCWEAKKTESERSDFCLETDKNQEQELIVIVPTLLSEKGKAWGAITDLKKFLNDNPDQLIQSFFSGAAYGEAFTIGNKTSQLSQTRKIAWIRPEKFFLSDVLLISKEKNKPLLNESAGLSQINNGAQYILPLKEEVLRYFNATTIKKLTPTIKEDSPGVLRFSMNLNILDHKNNKRQITIEKVYSTRNINGEGLIKEVDIPVMELFPQYTGENWRQYYLFYSHAEKYNIKPVSSATLGQDQEKRHNDIMSEKDSSERRENRVVNINGKGCYPEGLAITERASGATISAGLILLPKDQTIDAVQYDVKRTVGIDFGTTNTNIYIKDENDDKPKIWKIDLSKHFYQITNVDNAIREKSLEKYFLPRKEIAFPVPTAIRIYDLTVDNRLMLDFVPYFMNEYLVPPNVYTNIKWEEISQQGQTTKQFKYFKSLLFLLLLDAATPSKEAGKGRVGQIKFKVSYPKVFSLSELETFKAAWMQSLKELINDEHPVVDVLDEMALESDNKAMRIMGTKSRDSKKDLTKAIRFETEGRAAGEYFADTKIMKAGEASLHQTCVCFDVGGGTTDISVWGGENEIVSDSSVLLAGKHITQMLQNNEKLRAILFPGTVLAELNKVINDNDKFAAALNHALKTLDQTDDISNILMQNASNKEIKWLKKMIMLEFGSIAYYTAMVAYASSKGDTSSPIIERLNSSRFKCYWGGNGARYINWLDSGVFTENGFADTIFDNLFGRAIYDINKEVRPKRIMTILSPMFKSEASGGIVIMASYDQDEEESARQRSAARSSAGEKRYDDDEINDSDAGINLSKIVVGEDLVMKRGTPIRFIDEINTKNLYFDDEANNKKELLVKDVSTAKFERFIKTINKYGAEAGLLDETMLFKFTEREQEIVKDKIMQALVLNLKKPKNMRKIEPIFITEARAYIEYLISTKSS